jgi:hypothetical protein
MNPYYVWPALALGVVVAAKASTPRFVLASAVGIFTTVVGQWHLAWLPWWLLVVGGMTIVLVAAASPRPVEAELPIETSRFRVWLAGFFEMRPPAIITASSGSNTSAATKTLDPQPRAKVTASSGSNTSAATKTLDPQPQAKVTASSGSNTSAATKTLNSQPRAKVTAASGSNVSAVRKKRKRS